MNMVVYIVKGKESGIEYVFDSRQKAEQYIHSIIACGKFAIDVFGEYDAVRIANDGTLTDYLNIVEERVL